MKYSNIGTLEFEANNFYEPQKMFKTIKTDAQTIQFLFASVRRKTYEDGSTEKAIYDQYENPICRIHEPPSFFVNRFTYQSTDSANKYQMVASINTNILDILVMKCVEEIRPISRRFTLLEMDCNYLNIPFEEGLEVFDANECNWIRL